MCAKWPSLSTRSNTLMMMMSPGHLFDVPLGPSLSTTDRTGCSCCHSTYCSLYGLCVTGEIHHLYELPMNSSSLDLVKLQVMTGSVAPTHPIILLWVVVCI